MRHKTNIKIGASILAADFAHLDKEIVRIERAGVDFLHVDIMDGNFVPNITIGPDILKDLRKLTALPFDVHLMIKRPLVWTSRFIDAGADYLTLHIETISPLIFRKEALRLKSKGIKLGISLNPKTPLNRIEGLLSLVDFVLVMAVNPGFGGQRFMVQVLPRIKALRKIFNGDIAVDGGINSRTAAKVIGAGANILDCGTYIFESRNPKQIIRQLREIGGQ